MTSSKSRIQLLNKIAKSSKILTPLSGKVSRKDIEKYLKLSREIYDQNYTELKEAQAQLSKIENIIADKRNRVESAKSAMNDCYRYLQSMDRISSDTIKVDKDDVAYLRENRWYHYNPDDESLELYRKYKRDLQSADDYLKDDLEQEELSEGFDIIKE